MIFVWGVSYSGCNLTRPVEKICYMSNNILKTKYFVCRGDIVFLSGGKFGFLFLFFSFFSFLLSEARFFLNGNLISTHKNLSPVRKVV